jgi:phage terminase large subunit GpA-like protein
MGHERSEPAGHAALAEEADQAGPDKGDARLYHWHGALAARLRIEGHGPGYCHFPIGRGLDWYEGLTSERPIRKYHKGVATRVWTKTANARNEPLDCRCLAQAALEGLKASGLRLEIEIRRTRDPNGTAPPRVTYSKWMRGH